MKTPILYIFLFFSLNSIASNIKIERAKELISSNPDSSFLLVNEGLQIAKNEDDILSQVDAYYIKGYLYKRHNKDYANSIISYLEGIRIAKDSKDPDVVDVLLSIRKNLGNIYSKNIIDYKLAVSNYLEAFNIALIKNDLYNLSHLSYLIGALYISLEEYEKANEFLNNSKDYNKQLGNRELEIKILNSLAIVSKLEKKYDEALERYELCKTLSEKEDYKSYLLLSTQNIASIYYELEKYEISEKYYNRAIVLANEIDDSRILIISQLDLLELYIDTEQYDKASDLSEKVMIQDTQNQIRLYDSQIKLAKIKNKLEDVLFYMQKKSDLNNNELVRLKNIEKDLARESLQHEIDKYYYMIEKKQQVDQLYDNIYRAVIVVLSIIFIFYLVQAIRTNRKRKKINEDIRTLESNFIQTLNDL